MGAFIDANMSFVHTKRMTVSHILVSINIRTGLREEVEFILGRESQRHTIDCEGLMFQCHRGHVYGHVAKHCTLPFSKGPQWT